MTRFATYNAYGFSQTTEITDAEIARLAPSVFATNAHESRSAQYVYIPTSKIVTALRQEGWKPTLAQQSRVRDQSRHAHTKHLLRFRHADDLNTPAELNATVPEIVLLNSHDGSSSYQLHAGLFRFVCSNGMVVADTCIAQQRIPHKGDIVDNVIEGVYTIVEDLPDVADQVETFRSLTLSEDEQHAFGQAAMALRWDHPEESGFSPEQVTQARRCEDKGADLWSALNRTQENLIRGGLHGWKRDVNNRPRRTSSREVKGVQQNVQLNKALWTLAEEMLKLKAA
jgi:hypothetical protein